MNKSREGEGNDDDSRVAAGKVVNALREVLEADEARRLLLLNAFPDVLDHMMAALDA